MSPEHQASWAAEEFAEVSLGDKRLDARLIKLCDRFSDAPDFARPGEALDSFSERSPANAKNIGNAIGPLGWVVTEDTVVYTYTASNGGAHNYYHDTKTGLTYQSSAYW